MKELPVSSDGPAGASAGPSGLSAARDVDPSRGLDPDDLGPLRARYGPNELPTKKAETLLHRLFRHAKEPTALLLVAAAAVAGLGLGERLDALAIVAIVVLNISIGVIQEGRAARALDALRAMETPTARVVRGAKVGVIPVAEIVPGDVVLLSAGDRVPADVRLAETSALEIDESVLTGESLPVPKQPEEPVAGRPLGDRPWMAFTGTMVTRGSGRGVAEATGSRTELGRIALSLAAAEPRTPLQEELSSLAARLGVIAVLVAVLVFVLILARAGVGAAAVERSFLAAVALAVAAVPEGLATVVTVALALGVRRMAREGAIVRRLPAVETLGSTTVILTDKTGTLTQNRMALHSFVLPDAAQPRPREQLGTGPSIELAEAAVLCNDAVPGSGDPVEVALLEAVHATRVADVRSERPRAASIPFDPARRRMTTLHRDGTGMLLLVKGAPESVLELCQIQPAQRGAMEQAAGDLAHRGARVLAFASRRLTGAPEDLAGEEHDLGFLGLIGLRDPVRPEAAGAVSEARDAGIRIVMVTGDHPGTAQAVAKEVGLTVGDHPSVTGPDIRSGRIPDDPAGTPVYARMDPDQKLELVKEVRRRGGVVAVTGDGVNDAPALRSADIGVAMGRTGSDVAREAADLVVTDDNLATIVTAVREGRGIYDNIRKVVDYLVAGNLSEIAVVVGTLLIFPEVGVPLLPLQLLWVNLLTDGLPAIALGIDRVDEGVMTRPPRSRGERLLGGRNLTRLLLRGLLMAAASIGALAIARFGFGEPWAHGRAVMFSVLVTAHLLSAFVARLPTRGFSPPVLGAVLVGMALQMSIVLWTPAHAIFRTAILTSREWLLVLAGGALPVAISWFIERRRHVSRRAALTRPLTRQ